MNKQEFKKHLYSKIDGVVFESEDDDAAAEYIGELNSIIEAIEGGKDVKAACEWVGETYLITEDGHE